MDKKLKIYPSAAAFASGHLVTTKYNSGCLRYILVAKYAPRPQFNPAFAAVGALHEDLLAAKMGDKIAHRELPFKRAITPQTELSGRCDFITTDGEILETKGSYSKTMLKNVIEGGKFEIGHLAQLTAYMIHFHQPKGRIVVGYYEEAEDGTLVQQGYRELVVTIDSEGHILVDDVDTGFTVYNQLAHTLLVADVLENDTLYPRPANYESWSSPCRFCPLKDTCDDYDFGATTKDEFIKAGVEDIKYAPPMQAKINKMKVKKARKS